VLLLPLSFCDPVANPGFLEASLAQFINSAKMQKIALAIVAVSSVLSVSAQTYPELNVTEMYASPHVQLSLFCFKRLTVLLYTVR
jgi:hypothetical protein